MTPPSPWGDDAVLPTVIQGGMGVGVSAWRLASAVAADGQLGVVSVLEAPGHHHVQGGAGDHSQLSVGRNGGGESPRGHANTHPALDHGWQDCVVAPRGGWCHRSASPTYGGVGY